MAKGKATRTAISPTRAEDYAEWYQQDEYREWLDHLPDSLRESALADKLEAICDLDLDELDGVEPPLGYGRD